MKVTVDPYRPISGILPKNKLISEKMELDLNRTEIVRCTQFGTVFDEDLNVIDINNIDQLFKQNNKKDLHKHIDFNLSQKDNIPIQTKSVVEESKESLYTEDDQKEFEKQKDIIYYAIDKLKVEKEDNHIILPFEFKILSEDFDKVGGNLYGLLTFTGSRPTQLEYLAGDNWIKFNNRFNNISTLVDGDKFTFRFIPKNNSTIKYKFSIKDSDTNQVLIEQSGEIDPSEFK